MAYIYKIYNDVNDKLYIGKTEFNIGKRFKEHCNDKDKRKFEKRPLYDAMNKYGVEHFFVELVEETDKPEEREMYWIKQYNSYHNGYNATMGGDGKKYIDYNEVLNLWNQGLNCKEIANYTNHDVGHISKILNSKGITVEEKRQRQCNTRKIPIYQLDKNTEEIITKFESAMDASRILSIDKAHIAAVCKGKRKTAGGYKWMYVKENF